MSEGDRDIFNADDALSWSSQRWQSPPMPWKNWLLASGSLTRQLIRLSDGQFSVEVVEQGWRACRRDALRSCFRPAVLRQRMWSRKVVLLGRGQPWVTAHTLVPASSLRGSLRRLRYLDEQPLGQFLFRQPSLRRGQLELAPTGEGWGRRSLFYVEGKPLLVAEFFLPALIGREQERNR